MTIIPMRRDAESPLSQSIRREAQAFRIWRFAKGRNWQVTAQEIHEATGIRRATIRAEFARKAKKIGGSARHDVSISDDNGFVRLTCEVRDA